MANTQQEQMRDVTAEALAFAPDPQQAEGAKAIIPQGNYGAVTINIKKVTDGPDFKDPSKTTRRVLVAFQGSSSYDGELELWGKLSFSDRAWFGRLYRCLFGSKFPEGSTPPPIQEMNGRVVEMFVTHKDMNGKPFADPNFLLPKAATVKK